MTREDLDLAANEVRALSVGPKASRRAMESNNFSFDAGILLARDLRA
jgi:hypothetical protein